MLIPQNNILDIIISLTLIYAILSILVSILMEWWNYYRKTRAKMLKQSIYQLLKDDTLNLDYGDLLYKHFAISGLKSSTNRLPQYISSGMFAEALIDVIAKQAVHAQEIKLENKDAESGKKYETAGDPPPEKVIDRFKLSVSKMNVSPFTDVLNSFWDKSNGDYDKLKQLIENWYNDYMDRVTGWYKGQQKWKFVFFGFIVALGINADSIHMIKVLSMDDALRTKLAVTAENVADQYSALADSAKQNNSKILSLLNETVFDSTRKDTANKTQMKDIARFLMKKDSSKYVLYAKKLLFNDSISTAYLNRVDSVLGIASAMNLPVGWSCESAPASWFKCGKKCKKMKGPGLMAYNHNRNNCPDFGSVMLYFLGIFISAFSLSFGAPFWFDLLIKLVNIRRAGKKPEVPKK